MNFSNRVKFVRMKLQISQDTLAKELGVSYSTIGRWERESREPQMATLGKFYTFCEKNGIRFENDLLAMHDTGGRTT